MDINGSAQLSLVWFNYEVNTFLICKADSLTAGAGPKGFWIRDSSLYTFLRYKNNVYNSSSVQ